MNTVLLRTRATLIAGDKTSAKYLREAAAEIDALRERLRQAEQEIAGARERLGPAGWKMVQELLESRERLSKAEENQATLRKLCDDVERAKERREAYATKLEERLKLAEAVVEAVRLAMKTGFKSSGFDNWTCHIQHAQLMGETLAAYDRAATREGGEK